MINEKIYDKLGNEIVPGCFITYASEQGDSPVLKIGRVTKISTKERKTFGGKTFTEYRIQCHSIENWSGKTLQEKKGTLMFPERIVVIDRLAIKKEYLDLLNSVEL